MGPTLVVVTGSRRRQAAAIGRLQAQLAHRGLRVCRLKTSGERLVGDPDVVILSCPLRNAARLTEWIERTWTRQWEEWYARLKRLP